MAKKKSEQPQRRPARAADKAPKDKVSASPQGLAETGREDTLRALREACLAVAREQRACYPEASGLTRSPLDEHCSVVAALVRAVFGGDFVTGRINGARHYWNRLPDGQEVDLTSCQFGGDGFSPLKRGRKVKPPELIHPLVILFAELVRLKLSE
jgi:hypothetical protein